MCIQAFVFAIMLFIEKAQAADEFLLAKKDDDAKGRRRSVSVR